MYGENRKGLQPSGSNQTTRNVLFVEEQTAFGARIEDRWRKTHKVPHTPTGVPKSAGAKSGAGLLTGLGARGEEFNLGGLRRT